VGAPEGPIEEVNAVTLVTADMEAAVRFYRALGFPLLSGGTDAAFTTLQAGRSFLNLQAGPRPAPGGLWGRVIFFVDDVDGLHRRVLAAGYEPETAPADASWGERYFHVRDPDGHELSFARPIA
jgi:catechol 2,3-dioxygenase-like lactoylglutathione lyase family enzyme